MSKIKSLFAVCYWSFHSSQGENDPLRSCGYFADSKRSFKVRNIVKKLRLTLRLIVEQIQLRLWFFRRF
jgi:hypothetical protein